VVSRDVEIYFETAADRSDPPVLFVMGLGAQLIAWPDEWCAGVAGS